jgi:hypothetical protein
MKDCYQFPSPSTTELQHGSEIEPADPASRHRFLDLLLKVESWFVRLHLQIAYKSSR